MSYASGMSAHYASATISLLVSVALSVPAVAQAAPKRIHIIGASVRGGFEDGPLFGAKEAGDSVSMHHMLKRWCDGEVKVTTHPPMEMCYTFNDPLKIGKKQIDGCKKRKADMVVAVDFPFWFANTPLANLWLAQAQLMGTGMTEFGDSTGPLSGLLV